jgi:Vacuolar sorting 38 and autophagy-related subunit 14
MRGVQATWEHLEEKIALEGEWWRGGIYKTMMLRITQMLENGSIILVLEAPLHPSKLERLQVVPASLPPNTLLIDFSDGSTRCTPSLFQILYHQKLTDPAPLEDFSRFEDEVFSTLDGVEPTPSRRRAGSLSALLEPQDLNSRLIDEFDGGTEDETVEATTLFEEKEEEITKTDLLSEQARILALIAKEEDQLKEDARLLEEVRRHLVRAFCSESAIKSYAHIIVVTKERIELSWMVEEVKTIEEQIHQVKLETRRQECQLRREEFQKEAQHMKLIRELKRIYPITLDSQKGFLIRGLRLPVDILTTAVPEDEISAALGFCSHLVFMVAKYLSIPMRYRIFCNSSRSAIQLDGTKFLPLFTARSVEREHLETAMSLLGENADCILITLGIEFTPKSHILARLKRVYDHIIEGEISLLENGFH